MKKLILSIEVFQNKLKEYSSEEANDVLKKIKDIINSSENIYEGLTHLNIFDGKIDTSIDYKIFLKSLYKTEAIAHKIVYKKTKNIKTEDILKDGVFKMTSEFINSNKAT